MKSAAFPDTSLALTLSRFAAAALFLMAALTTGCGSGGNSAGTPTFSGTTSMTVVLSSTANDQLEEFGLVLQAIDLTSQSGTSVHLLSTPQGAEFMTVNGGGIPLATVSIPQGIYTSASVTVGSAQFTCITLDSSGGIDNSTYAYGQTPASNVSVNFSSPITVTGSVMGLSVDLQVLQSASYPSTCYTSGTASYSITPTFTVTPLTFSAVPTNSSNGKITGLRGQIGSKGTSGNSFALSLPIVNLTCPCIQPSPLTILTNSNTVYQDMDGFSALSVGSLLDLDGIIQADGSVLATRVAAYDAAATDVMAGPLLFLDTTVPVFYTLGRQQNGQTLSVQPQSVGFYSLTGSTSFQISGQFSNVSSLPFAASFNGANMVAGQNIAVFSQAITDYYGGDHTAATTVTLMPQTIDGTITGSATIGGFTVYTVSLAPYDLFPTLATQPGQTTLLTNPSEVQVYVDGNTQLMNTQALAMGKTLRFQGLVFNDSGTLRMDCAQVNDGVTFSTSSNPSSQAEIDATWTLRRTGIGTLPQVTSSLTRSH
ncbi:MAG TPA: DUF5666 domain-containing protein [Terriglobales bacterium]|nr:DUF5666 domain-containing protein [Terriglobales bacterium]